MRSQCGDKQDRQGGGAWTVVTLGRGPDEPGVNTGLLPGGHALSSGGLIIRRGRESEVRFFTSAPDFDSNPKPESKR